MTDSISIEIHEHCPAGLEIFQNERLFSVSFTASGGVGDCEVLNAEKEVIALVQKHLSTISLLEHTSRSEVLTVETVAVDSSTDSSLMPISCPPTEEVAAVTNVRVGLFQPNTLEIVSRGRFTDSRAMDFRWELCDSRNSSNNKGSSTNNAASSSNAESSGEDSELVPIQCNYRLVNHASVTVAEIFLRRNSSSAIVRLSEEQHLSPVQIAVIFGGLSFLVLSVKKQRSLVRFATLFLLLGLGIAAIVLVSVAVP